MISTQIKSEFDDRNRKKLLICKWFRFAGDI